MDGERVVVRVEHVPVPASTAIAAVRASEMSGERSDFVSLGREVARGGERSGDGRRGNRDGAER
jgi:hypothetical protein